MLKRICLMTYHAVNKKPSIMFIQAKLNQNFLYTGRVYSKYGFFTAYRYDTRSVVNIPLEASIIPCDVEVSK